jgi:hypothetical protein
MVSILSYKVCDIVFSRQMGWGFDPEKTLELAILFLVKYLDATVLSLVERLVNTSVASLEFMTTRGNFSATELAIHNKLITTIVKAFESSEDPKVIGLLIQLVKYAIPLPSYQRAHGLNNVLIIPNSMLKSIVHNAINSWKQANNNYALTLLRNNVGEAEELIELLHSQANLQNSQTSYPARVWKDTTLSFPEM